MSKVPRQHIKGFPKVPNKSSYPTDKTTGAKGICSSSSNENPKSNEGEKQKKW